MVRADLVAHYIAGAAGGRELPHSSSTMAMTYARRVTVNADAGPSRHSATGATDVRDFARGTIMRIDSLLKLDKATLVFEVIGDDKVCVTCQR
jgi:hypothetical protein